jgi:subtilisin family serine protease
MEALNIINGENLKISKFLILVIILFCLFITTTFALDESRSIIKLPYLRSDGHELTGNGVAIAIIDTGINSTHPDFQEKTIVWNDIFASEADPYDDNGHGTSVASIAAGTGAASSGEYKGIAPGANLIIEKVCNSYGECSIGHVAAGIEDAIQNNANVIVLSLGGLPNPSAQECRCDSDIDSDKSAVCNAIKEALSENIAVVVAVGNDGNSPSTIEFPACIDGVIAVGADHKKSYANDLFSYNMNYAPTGIDAIHCTVEIHSIITVTSDNPPQVFENEWNGTCDSNIGTTGLQKLITPNNWPATVSVKVEAKHKRRDCYGSERIWWDPGSADKGDGFWTWDKTFNYDASVPKILVEVGGAPDSNLGSCIELTGHWMSWYNDYTCSGTTLSCDSFDSYKYGCENQASCSWCGCWVGGLIGYCLDVPPAVCQIGCPPGRSCSWHGCDGTAKACSDRHQGDGDICGNPSSTGCTASWNEDKNIYVNIEGAKTWEGLPSFLSSRGPSVHSPSLIEPLVTAPGMHICSARAFENPTNGAIQDCGNDNYVSDLGSSMAAPMVGGLVALMKEAKSTASNSEIVEALKHSDERVFSSYPNMEEGYGLVNAQKSIDNITNCNLRSGIHHDTDLPQCSGYDYNSYSSSYQIRDYFWSDSKNDCDCDANYDSYITRVAVNDVTAGDTGVLNTSNIEVYVDIKNTGTQQQSGWLVGVDFWKANDYNDPSTKTQEVYTWLTKISNGNSIGLSNAGCSLVNDPNSNNNLDPGETIRVKCWVPASYFVSTSGNQRIMFSTEEKDLSHFGVALSKIDVASMMVKIICRLPSIDSDGSKSYTIKGVCSDYYAVGASCQKNAYKDYSACIPKCNFGGPNCDIGVVAECAKHTASIGECSADENCTTGIIEYYVSGSGCGWEAKRCSDLGSNYFYLDGKCAAFIINITSPQNSSYYYKSYIPLSFNAGGAGQIGYSLDYQPINQTSFPVNLTNIPNGPHSIIVYATDSSGNAGSSNDTYFYYCKGDINRDKKVDITDIASTAKLFGCNSNKSCYYGTTNGIPNSAFDFNEDGKIDITDVAIIAKLFGSKC